MLTRLGVLLLPLILTPGLARAEEPAPEDGPPLRFVVRLVTVPAATYEKLRETFALDEKKPLLFGDKELFTFLETVQGDKEANILQGPRMATQPEKTASVKSGDEQWSVSGVRIALVNGNPIFSPEVTKTFAGLEMNLTPRMSEAAKVEVDLKVISTRLNRGEDVKVNVGEFTQLLQKREVVTNSVDRKLHLSFGKTVVLPGWWEEAKAGEKPSRVVVCVTAEGK